MQQIHVNAISTVQTIVIFSICRFKIANINQCHSAGYVIITVGWCLGHSRLQTKDTVDTSADVPFTISS